MTAVDPAPTAGTARTARLDPDALADLEEQRAFLLRSIDDLEHERASGDIDDADYESLRDDYTRRAAEVIRAIDQGRAAFAAARADARPNWPRRAAIAAVVAVFAVGAGIFVAQSSGTRLPGDTISGGIDMTASGQLQRAAQLAQSGDMVGALELYDEILADEPDHERALTERGFLLVMVSRAAEEPGLLAEGKRSIERALALDPQNAQALLYLGMAHYFEGDVAASDAAIERALAADPSAQVQQSIEQFRAMTSGGGAGPGPNPDPAEAPATGGTGDPAVPDAEAPAG